MLLCGPAPGWAQLALPASAFAITPANTSIELQTDCFGIFTCAARFTRFHGLVAPALGATRISLCIDARSITSSFPAAALMLRSAEFFDAARHPMIAFDAAAQPSRPLAPLQGSLRIRGISHSATLQVEARADGSIGARTTVDRADFGMTTRRGVIGGEVAISARLAASMIAVAPPLAQAAPAVQEPCDDRAAPPADH